MLGAKSRANAPRCTRCCASAAAAADAAAGCSPSVAATSSSRCRTCSGPRSGCTVKSGESQRLRESGRSNLQARAGAGRGGAERTAAAGRANQGRQLAGGSTLRTLLQQPDPPLLPPHRTTYLHAAAWPQRLPRPTPSPAGKVLKLGALPARPLPCCIPLPAGVHRCGHVDYAVPRGCLHRRRHQWRSSLFSPGGGPASMRCDVGASDSYVPLAPLAHLPATCSGPSTSPRAPPRRRSERRLACRAQHQSS